MDLYSVYGRLKRAYALASRNLPGGYAMPPVNLVIELTYRCNLKCQMCYQRNQFDGDPGIRRPKAEELSFAEIRRIIDQTPPFCLIIFSGGEPFCRQDLFEILDYATRKRKCHMVTNGSLMTDSQAIRLANSNLLSVGFSIDGDQALHDQIRGVPGTYERLIHNVQVFRQQREANGRRQPVINFKTVITSGNAADLMALYRIAQDSGADYLTFQIENQSLDLSAIRLSADFSPYLQAPEPFAGFDLLKLRENLRFLNQKTNATRPKVRVIPDFSMSEVFAYYSNGLHLQDYTCDAPWTGINISPYGDAFPCFNFQIGNIREMSLAKLWNHPRYRGFRKAVRKRLFPGCMGCCDLEGRPAAVEKTNRLYSDLSPVAGS